MRASDDLKLLLDAARSAGEIALRYFDGGAEQWEKPGNQGLVTEADLAVDAHLLQLLLDARPHYGWLSEETQDNPRRLSTEHVFVIDPIDGTRSFASGDRTWALSLAVVEAGVPVAAVIHLPARRLTYTAHRGAAPGTGTLAVTAAALAAFRATLAENITVMITVYVGLAAIIALGVVYNFARIALSEQGRELASLRVLGFTEGEVSAMLFAELAIVTLAAQPPGWLIGHGMAAAMAAAFSSDLYRVPFVVGREVHAIASLVVCAAAFLSALAIRGRIRRLDIVAVLKTRE
ncbi:inositol monophosphatase family protein [Mangrovicoccus ximenensis]|uniref:inositol monophosphatase family protein n=1 Tax=Mangrovicoccus ximenensis TaxID=1911570 RepID=UPI000D399C56|nr:inositol monophosphatase family protein [Mangrovicoccus ximenensis]